MDSPNTKVLTEQLAYFDLMVERTAREPHLHREADLWRALATEVRRYLNPGPQRTLPDHPTETPPREA